MKLSSTQFAGFLAILVGLFAASTVSEGGFNINCTVAGAVLADKKYLGAYCTNDMVKVHGYNWTWIDLDWCVANDAGHLKLKSHGGFSGSCSHCSFDVASKGGDFSCQCTDSKGKLQPKSTVELNKELWSKNGALGCFEHIGNKTRAGPQCKTCDD